MGHWVRGEGHPDEVMEAAVQAHPDGPESPYAEERRRYGNLHQMVHIVDGELAAQNYQGALHALADLDVLAQALRGFIEQRVVS